MRVLLAGGRPHDRDHGRKSALGVGYECVATDCVPITDLRLRLARSPAVDLVVVYLDPDPAAAFAMIGAAAAESSQPIYAVTTGDVESAQEAALEAGAAGVWPASGVREQMLRSSEEIRRESKSVNRRGRVIAVAAALPGTGVTTVATGLAFALTGKGPVALAELGAGVPELALDLDLKPRHSLAELIASAERMDTRMIRDAAVEHPAGVSVLAYLPETPAAETIPATVARDFQILLRGVYDWSVLDAGHPTSPSTDDLLRHSDLVVLVTRLDPPSMRLTKRYARSLTDAGVPAANVALVANRYGQGGQVSWRKAEEALQTPIKAWLPDDPRAVNRALTDGQPLARVARGSRLNRALNKLAGALRLQLAPATV